MKFENLLPIFAPFPPAVVIGMQLYREVVAASSADWWALAAFAALVGTVGTIGAEMYSYKMALRALADKEKGAFLVAIAGALLTSGLIIWAVWRSDDSRPLVVSVIVAIVGYMVAGLSDYLKRKAIKRAEQVTNSISQIQAQTALEQARAKIAAAEARKAKAEHAEPVRRRTGRTDEQTTNKLDPARLASVRAYIEGKKSAGEKYTIREVAKACGIPSSSTASDYIKAVQS